MTFLDNPSLHYHYEITTIVGAFHHHKIEVIVPFWIIPQNAEIKLSVKAINGFGSFVTEPRSICK